MASYSPIATDVRMSDYGYWIVTISVSPWQRMSIMICQVGITPEQAADLALGITGPVLNRKAT